MCVESSAELRAKIVEPLCCVMQVHILDFEPQVLHCSTEKDAELLLLLLLHVVTAEKPRIKKTFYKPA